MYNCSLSLAALLVLFTNIAYPVAAADHQSQHSTVAATMPPAKPPGAVCGNKAILDGPGSAPAGAVVVQPGQNLTDATADNPAGTTFYLTAGTHTLKADAFAQVIPKDGNSYIGAPGAVLDGRGLNYFAFTQHAINVNIKHLTVTGFVAPHNEGVVNHDGGVGWKVTNNTIENNQGAGVMVGTDSVLADNCLRNNGQYGFSSFHTDGIRDVVVTRNEIVGNNTGDWENVRPGCGCSGGGKFWDVRRAQVTDNWVHDNHHTGLWADYNNSEFLFEGNTIEDNNGPGIFYELSYNFMIRHNVIRRNEIPRGLKNQGENFPYGGIYISESGGDERAGATYAVSEIHSNLIENNWDGVVLWESPDRFCKSPYGGVSATCPWFDQTYGARNKTQNIKVHDNTFIFDPVAVGCTSDRCGRNGLFSQWGNSDTYPGWVIADAVTFQQGNVFSNNSYAGPWAFTSYDANAPKPWSVWQAAPYNQDAGSTYNGSYVGVPPPVQLPEPPSATATRGSLWNTWTSGTADAWISTVRTAMSSSAAIGTETG